MSSVFINPSQIIKELPLKEDMVIADFGGKGRKEQSADADHVLQRCHDDIKFFIILK